MKILMIIDMGYLGGGAENYVFGVKQLLEKRGHIVRILSSDRMPKKKHFSDYEFKSKINLPLYKRIPYYLFYPASFLKLKSVLKEFKPDIVNLHTIEECSLSILLLLKKIPTIWTLHGPEVICPKGTLLLPSENICPYNFSSKCIKCLGFPRYNYEQIKYIFSKLLMKNIDLSLAINKDLKMRFYDTRRLHVKNIKYGCNLFKYIPIKNKYHVLYSGRLTRYKGIDYLLKAMPEIIKKYPQTKLTIAGDGPEKENLIRITKKLSITDNVIFLGWIPRDKIENIYANTTLLVSPSIWYEVFGQIGPEAMSVGRPVIATNVGGIPEWCIDGLTGYIVPTRNSKAIADKVIKLFSNNKLLQKMSKAASIKAEEYDMKKHVIKLEKIYTELILKSDKKNIS
jgi:glycosyltransferase involved in cell wall biosynthesis